MHVLFLFECRNLLMELRNCEINLNNWVIGEKDHEKILFTLLKCNMCCINPFEYTRYNITCFNELKYDFTVFVSCVVIICIIIKITALNVINQRLSKQFSNKREMQYEKGGFLNKIIRRISLNAKMCPIAGGEVNLIHYPSASKIHYL